MVLQYSDTQPKRIHRRDHQVCVYCDALCFFVISGASISSVTSASPHVNMLLLPREIIHKIVDDDLAVYHGLSSTCTHLRAAFPLGLRLQYMKWAGVRVEINSEAIVWTRWGRLTDVFGPAVVVGDHSISANRCRAVSMGCCGRPCGLLGCSTAGHVLVMATALNFMLICDGSAGLRYST